jgi:hypothetical protein
MLSRVLEHYSHLEDIYKIRSVNTNATYISPVNFSESLSATRHRWFPYKEGFSPTFVKSFLADYCEEISETVFDPFSGVGTTAIAASSLGFDGIGFDISPLAIFVAETKSILLNEIQIEDFRSCIKNFGLAKLTKSVPPPENETVIKYFDPEYLTAFLKIKFFIKNIGVKDFEDLFKLALLALIEKFSTHRKAGNGVKKKTRFDYGHNDLDPLEELRQDLVSMLEMYISDMLHDKEKPRVKFYNVSSLDPNSYEKIDNISAVITSPPYANCFDYSKIYMRELWFGDFFLTKADHKIFRNDSVRSHVHSTWEPRNESCRLDIVDDEIKPILDSQKLWSNKIGSMLSGYFKDINRSLQLIKPKLKKGAPLGFVVGNSFYGGTVIATDLLVAELAQKSGYKIEEIINYRKIIPSSQQFKKIGDKHFMRESMVVFRNA